jgi:Pyruvate/2-oxoacid:ferredoxin oxidoreductase gamma subunit
VRAVPVPFTEIALHLGKSVVKNVVALGAMQEATGILAPASFEAALRENLRDKCAMIPLNEAAFRWGGRAVREGITRFEA